MPLILPGNVGSATAATGYNVANSLRFNAGDSPELSFTVDGTPTHQDKGTWSFWIKRGNIFKSVRNYSEITSLFNLKSICYYCN